LQDVQGDGMNFMTTSSSSGEIEDAFAVPTHESAKLPSPADFNP
jgi:hypothetical protein